MPRPPRAGDATGPPDQPYVWLYAVQAAMVQNWPQDDVQAIVVTGQPPHSAFPGIRVMVLYTGLIHCTASCGVGMKPAVGQPRD